MYKLVTLTKPFIFKWSVLFFALFCAIAYEHTALQSQKEFTALSEQLQALQGKKQQALMLKEVLKAKVQSQADPQWIELTLRKNLGMKAFEEKKILFQEL